MWLLDNHGKGNRKIHFTIYLFHTGILVFHIVAANIMEIKNTVRRIWGSDSSRSFKLASWAIAFGVYGVWYVYENKKNLFYEIKSKTLNEPYYEDVNGSKK